MGRAMRTLWLRGSAFAERRVWWVKAIRHPRKYMGKIPQAPLKRFREELVEFGHRECFSERALAISHHRPRTTPRMQPRRRPHSRPSDTPSKLPRRSQQSVITRRAFSAMIKNAHAKTRVDTYLFATGVTRCLSTGRAATLPHGREGATDTPKK